VRLSCPGITRASGIELDEAQRARHLAMVDEVFGKGPGRHGCSIEPEGKPPPARAGGAMSATRNLAGLIGKRLFYTYENGWRYEIYVKNGTCFSYRVHSGIVGGRWVTDQEAHIQDIGDDVYGISWDEPTGTTVSLAINLARRRLYCTFFHPRWVADDPTKTICYQNLHLDRMRRYRDAGPTYPKLVLDESAAITFVEDCGPDRDDIIDRPSFDLPPGYADRRN
jgi:phenolic acid decarboxylase